MQRSFILLTALLSLACAAASPARAADEYVFSFDYGNYRLTMPTSAAPEVKYYIDTKGGEYDWRIDGDGDLNWLYGMSRPMFDGVWRYTFENCKDIERGEIKTLKVGDVRWKYSISDVTLKIDDSERTYVDLWCTRAAWRHVLRFSYSRSDDHEETLKNVKAHMKRVEWWN